MNVSGITNDRLADLTFVNRDEEQRAYVRQQGLIQIAINDHTVARLKCARDQAEKDAIKNLARYKFSNFGYHAARWVTLTRIIGDRKPNPFQPYVKLARELGHA